MHDVINWFGIFAVYLLEIIRISLQEIFAELDNFGYAGFCGDRAVIVGDDESGAVAVFAFGVVEFLVDEQHAVSIAFRISVGIADCGAVCSGQ